MFAMMTQFPSFLELFQPQIHNIFNRDVDSMERKIHQARQLNDADKAERMLDQACDELLANYKREVDEIRASIKQKRPSHTSSTEQSRYNIFVEAATVGIRQNQEKFDTIFSRLRNIVNSIVDWIRQGLAWNENLIRDHFSSIRSLLQ